MPLAGAPGSGRQTVRQDEAPHSNGPFSSLKALRCEKDSTADSTPDTQTQNARHPATSPVTCDFPKCNSSARTGDSQPPSQRSILEASPPDRFSLDRDLSTLTTFSPRIPSGRHKSSNLNSLIVNLPSVSEGSNHAPTAGHPPRRSADSYRGSPSQYIRTQIRRSAVSLPQSLVSTDPGGSVSTASLVMDAAVRAAGIADAADPTANPSRDVELGQHYRSSQNPSRASLPLSHQRSFSLATSRHRTSSVAGDRPSTADVGDEQEKREEEHAEESNDIEWGPSHPCFPHANPHFPTSSPLYKDTRIIRVKRDWMVAGDLAPAFSNLYPEILAPLLPEDRFWELIRQLNGMLVRIFSPYRPRSWLDAGMGVLTGWLWDDLGFTGAKLELVQLEKWLEQWNKDYGEAEGMRIIPLRRTGFMCLDIQIPDLQIGPEGEDDSSVAPSRVQRTFSTRSKSTVGRPGSSRAGEAEGMAHPVVPPIPGKYLEEAQQQVEQQVEKQQEQQREVRGHEEQERVDQVQTRDHVMEHRVEERGGDGEEKTGEGKEVKVS